MALDTYQALVALTADPDGLHRRVSVVANSLTQAKKLLTAEYGDGRVISLWSEREAAKPRTP
jgi:hypothetical protein